ncbi:T9SS type A sorting domain-containing protein [Arcicella aquatica]|uniref:T9SS type A sorting domain-containing protein n=1 Tax=Arcicella aquatica TaxID=217141 RepID=A0ABU5QI76_9BACT|nr:T9SS type A sorting domain-containing protein [Arcicella aquatica]MEA5256429.1 T9SS type A sorting domain-containing protein [Arcicella aquatica]
MNNFTQRTLLVILFLIASLGVVLANGSTSISEENKNSTNTSIPDAPTVQYVGIERCGYQSIGDPRSAVVLRSSGCNTGTITWYDSNGTDLGLNKPTTEIKILEISSDITVYATCSIGTDVSPHSNELKVKHISAPPLPHITQDKIIACDGETVTLKSSNVTNPTYEYRWQRMISVFPSPNYIDPSTEGFGTPELKTKVSGYYYLSVVAPECPQAPAYADGQVYVEFYSLPKPKITVGTPTFCEDIGTTLKVDSIQFIKNYQWYVNGVKQDNLGTVSHIEKFNKTASIQVVSVESRIGCLSPISDAVSLKAVTVPTKPVLTASALEFCEDKTVSLKADSSAVTAKYQWYINGVKQDSLGTLSSVKSFNKTATIQVLGVEKVLGCSSPLSEPVKLTALVLPTKPVITSSKANATICAGDTLSLTSTAGFSYNWNTGATTRTIANIKVAGKYALQIIDAKGCVSKSSDTTTIKVNALPAKPVVTASGPIAFCDGGTVTLTSTPNVKYVWSNNETTRSITLSTSKDLTVAVIDANNCTSPSSDLVKVTVYALPAKPTITSSGNLSFCADQSVIITSSDLINGEKTKYIWSSKDSTKSITVKTTGTFSVKVIDPRGCISPSSDLVSTVALPVPDAPTIAADGATIFCSRSNDDYSKINTVNLLATSPFEVTWSTGFVGKTLNLASINSQGTFVDISREYTAFAKNTATGCISPKSAPINIIVRNNPDASAASIEKDGTYTLKAVNFPTGNEYEWKYGSEVLAFKEGIIKANRFGDYTARIKTLFAIPSAPGGQLACFSNFSKAFSFKEDPSFAGLSIYPNPSNGLLTIETLADYDNPEILIYDLLGRQIYAGTLPTIKGKVIIDLRNNNEGEYMLRFKAANFDLTKRIIVNR